MKADIQRTHSHISSSRYSIAYFKKVEERSGCCRSRENGCYVGEMGKTGPHSGIFPKTYSKAGLRKSGEFRKVHKCSTMLWENRKNPLLNSIELRAKNWWGGSFCCDHPQDVILLSMENKAQLLRFKVRSLDGNESCFNNSAPGNNHLNLYWVKTQVYCSNIFNKKAALIVSQNFIQVPISKQSQKCLPEWAA